MVAEVTGRGHEVVNAACSTVAGFVISAPAWLRLCEPGGMAVVEIAAQETSDARQVCGDPIHD